MMQWYRLPGLPTIRWATSDYWNGRHSHLKLRNSYNYRDLNYLKCKSLKQADRHNSRNRSLQGHIFEGPASSFLFQSALCSNQKDLYSLEGYQNSTSWFRYLFDSCYGRFCLHQDLYKAILRSPLSGQIPVRRESW